MEVYNTFQLRMPGEGEVVPDDEVLNMANVLKKFDNFFVGQLNETVERYTFNSRNQKDDESVDQYVTALRTLAKICQFGELRDSLIHDRMECGIRNDACRKKLLQERKLTLNRCIDICKIFEQADRNMKIMKHVTPEELTG